MTARHCAARRPARPLAAAWLMVRFLPALLALLTTPAPWAHGTASPAQAVPAPAVAAATPADSGPPLSARYQVSYTPKAGRPQVQTWTLHRSATEIAWLKSGGQDDIWRRDRSGIRLDRVLHSDRHLIRYSAGELRTLAVDLDWQALGSLLNDADLARLRKLAVPTTGAAAAGLKDAHLPRYVGSLDGGRIDLRWDPVTRLPVDLRRHGPGGQVRYRLVAVAPVAPSDWPKAGAGSDDYQLLDAADFGDMAYNPVVRQQQARDVRAGWRHAHGD